MELGSIFSINEYPLGYDYAITNGYTIEEVEAIDGVRQFKIVEIPQPLPPTYEEVRQTRETLYRNQKDPITCQIQSLRDEEQTEDIIAEIEALIIKRAKIVAKIKEENPYPEENVKEITQNSTIL